MDTPTLTLDRHLDEAPTGTVVVETQTVRRPAGKVFWFFAVLVPVLLTIGLGVTRGPGIENNLKKDVLAALDGANTNGVGVHVDGRIITADVPDGVDVDRVKNLITEVDGVSAVTAKLVYASYAEAENCSHLQTKLDKVTNKERIPFVGRTSRLPAAGAQMLRDVAGILEACPTAVVYVGGHTDPGTRFGSTLTLERAKAMTKLLKSYGIAPERLAPRGYGDQFPVNDSGTAAGQARNERGSIVVRSQ